MPATAEQGTLLPVTSDDVREAADRIGPYEPAAAVPFAAWLGGRVSGRHPCLVVCGANTDWHPQEPHFTLGCWTAVGL